MLEISRSEFPKLRILLLLAASVLVALVNPIAMPARNQDSRRSNLPTLTSIDQIRALSPGEAALAYPIRLQAVVTYYGGSGWEFFVQDSSAGIYLDATDKAWPVKAGDLIELTGAASPGGFAPDIINVRIRMVGSTALPKAKLVTLDDLRTGREDGQYVEIEGIVRAATAHDSGHTTVELGSSGGSMAIELPFIDSKVSHMTDARVRVRGVCGTLFNKRRQLIGIQLYVQSLEQISVLEPAPQNPFSSPIRPIESLLQFAPQGASSHRVRVQGIVTLHLPGRFLYIRDDSDGLYVDSAQKTPLRVGDRVDVIGFPSIGDYSPILEHADYQKAGSGPPPAPAKITAEQALRGDFDAELVQIEGEIQHQSQRTNDQIWVMLANNIAYEVRIDEAETHGGWPSFPNRSWISLTGICSVQVSEDRVPRTFHILLRSPDDIRLLRKPSVWTLARALNLLAILSGIILAAFGWVFILRRRMQKQTEVIRQRLERQVALEKRFEYVARATNDAIWDYDLVAKKIWWSEAVKSLFGYEAGELDAARNWWPDRIHADDRERVLQSIRTAQEGGEEKWSEEYRFQRANGDYVCIYDRGYLMRDNSGKPIRMIGAMMDISARKHAEGALQRAKEAAESANKAKSAFLANMSHEIRTPMNGILGTTELILGTELTPEQREYFGMIKNSADSLLTVINDILDFSKIEAGKLDLDHTEFDLRRSLEETTKTFAIQAHAKGLELLCDIQPDVPEVVMGDPTRLRQILVNLLGNAIKFTGEGEVVLQVDLVSQIDSRVQLHFAVRDTGIGIPEEKRNSIFKAFAQADGSTTRKYGGTGLGLTISSRLVELMGGQIWVESKVGHGSSFHFTAHFIATKKAAPMSVPDEANLDGLRVLVVDDNETNLRILESTLAQWGMQVTLATCGTEALETLDRAQAGGKDYSLVITDAHMPGIDGFNLAEQIKQHRQMTGSTIVMLTSGGQRGDAARCRELGISAYLTKPICQSELRAAVTKVLGRKIHHKESRQLVTIHSLAEEKPPLRILLAEDNRVNQLLVVRLLTKRGHRVTVVVNGLECLDALKKEAFDLVLMDVQMPQMDGFQTTMRIRDMEKITGSHLVVFALTAHAMAGDQDRCLAAGMDDYLTKPVRSKELFETIERYFPSPGITPSSTLEPMARNAH